MIDQVSRALGDFTYKNRPDLPAKEQQVSAEPDITVHKLDGTEEFLILACDGIWDVMSNDGICEYVRKLMLDGETSLGLIAEEILDHCLHEGRYVSFARVACLSVFGGLLACAETHAFACRAHDSVATT